MWDSSEKSAVPTKEKGGQSHGNHPRFDEKEWPRANIEHSRVGPQVVGSGDPPAGHSPVATLPQRRHGQGLSLTFAW